MKLFFRGLFAALLTFSLANSASGESHHPTASPLGGTINTGQFAEAPTTKDWDPGVFDALLVGVDHVLDQQCPDGGFGFPHDDCSTTFHNITAPILIGALDVYRSNHSLNVLLGAVNGGIFVTSQAYSNGEARFGTFAPNSLLRLARSVGNTTFSTFVAEQFFQALDDAIYGPDDLDTAAWISAVETVRTGVWVNLRPWEFHTLIPAAAAMGQPGQAALFEQAVLDGLNTLDNSDPDNVFSDIIGLAGAVRGLVLAGRTSFPAISAPLHSGVDGIDSLEDLVSYLVSLQNPDGSWNWHSGLMTPTASDMDTQTTAYAVMALTEADRLLMPSYEAAARAGRDWLVSQQTEDGGFPSFPGGSENTEIEAEALAAIVAFSQNIFADGFESGDTLAWQ